MKATVLPIFSLLCGAAILLLGNGLQGILIPVRAGLEQFSTTSIGAIASAYSIGFVTACFLGPHVVRRVGHIRSFAVFSAIAASVILLMVLLPKSWIWLPLRIVSGFCFASLFMVIESWLNERATNVNRGQIFALYMIISMLASTFGQLLLPLGNPGGFELFALTCILITLGLVPVGLTSSAAPAPIGEVRLRLGRLYRISPVGVVGCFFVGAANSSHINIGAVYAQKLGFSLTAIAFFMSAAVIGGALSQYPLGRLSDRIDRRTVILVCCAASMVLGIVLAAVGGINLSTPDYMPRNLSPTMLIVTAVVFGFCVFPLYSLCVAHTNDHVQTEGFVETSSGLLLTYGFGAILGPLVASLLMAQMGPGGLYAFTALIHSLFAVFTLYRMTRRAPTPVDERTHFVDAGSSRSTPVAIEMDPRASEHEAKPG